MRKNNAPELTALVLINENAIHGLEVDDDNNAPAKPTISAGNLHKVALYVAAKCSAELLAQLKDETNQQVSRESLQADPVSKHLVQFCLSYVVVYLFCIF